MPERPTTPRSRPRSTTPRTAAAGPGQPRAGRRAGRGTAGSWPTTTTRNNDPSDSQSRQDERRPGHQHDDSRKPSPGRRRRSREQQAAKGRRAGPRTSTSAARATGMDGPGRPAGRPTARRPGVLTLRSRFLERTAPHGQARRRGPRSGPPRRARPATRTAAEASPRRRPGPAGTAPRRTSTGGQDGGADGGTKAAGRTAAPSKTPTSRPRTSRRHPA